MTWCKMHALHAFYTTVRDSVKRSHMPAVSRSRGAPVSLRISTDEDKLNRPVGQGPNDGYRNALPPRKILRFLDHENS